MYARPDAVSPSTWITPGCVCLHEVLQKALQPLDPGANPLAADGLSVDVRHPHRAVLREQRCQPVEVAHHHGVGVLAAQRLDLDAIGDGLKIEHPTQDHRNCCRSLSQGSGSSPTTSVSPRAL